jgi:hypothetical protein
MVDIQPSLFEETFSYVSPQGYGEGRGQFSSVSEDWWTHPEIVGLVHELYDGPPDLDPMSCAEANEIIQARKYYTAEMDGLKHLWYGKMILNPPWGGFLLNGVKRQAIQRLMDSYPQSVQECVCILNANAVTTSWFAPLLQFPICLPPRRIAHLAPGRKEGAPNSGTVIVYVGTRVAQFSKVFSNLGAIMVPYVTVGDQMNTGKGLPRKTCSSETRRFDNMILGR